MSVSILAPDCALADALATAFMVLGPERAEAVIDGLAVPGVAAMFLVREPDGGVRQIGLRW